MTEMEMIAIGRFKLSSAVQQRDANWPTIGGGRTSDRASARNEIGAHA